MSASPPKHDAAAPALCIVSLGHLRRAIRDEALDRGHLRVLANITERLNINSMTAWPSRERIGEEEGLDAKTVANKLYDLRRRGYVRWSRLPDEKRPTRTLVNYWLDEPSITEAVLALRSRIRNRSALPSGHSDCPAERAIEQSALPAVLQSARPAGLETALPAVLQSARPAGLETALPAVCKELAKGTCKGEGDAHLPTAPHMNGAGFVISQAHNKVIPAETVEQLRTRYADIPDLEAELTDLSLTLLKGGPTHRGWEHPAAWMQRPLADRNEKYRQNREIAKSQLATASPGRVVRTFQR